MSTPTSRLTSVPGSAGAPSVPPGYGRAGWRRWLRARPFWAALMVIAAGGEILAVHLAQTGGSSNRMPVAVVLAGGLIACGLLLVCHPVNGSLYSTAAILVAISALMTAHVGGYLIGTLLGGAGGSLAFAWVPREQPGPGGSRS